MASTPNKPADALENRAGPPAAEANKKRSYDEATDSKKDTDAPPLKEARIEESVAAQPKVQAQDNNMKEKELEMSKQNDEGSITSTDNKENSADKNSESDQEEDDEPPAPLLLQPSKMNEEDSTKFREADQRRSRDEKAVRNAHSKLMKAKAEMVKAQAKFEEWYVLDLLFLLLIVL